MKVVYLGNPRSIHLQRWANYFSERGWEVHIITYSPTKQGLRNEIVQHQLFRLGPLENILEPLIRRKRVIEVKQLLDKLKPDLIHAHDLSKYGEYAFLCGFKPYILTNWGLMDLDYVQNYMRFFKAKLSGSRWRLRKNVFQNAFKITTLVEDAKSLIIEKFDITPDKFSVFSWGVDLDLFKNGYISEVHDLRKQWGIPDDYKVVLSPRVMDPFYNIEMIIRAAATVLKKNSKIIFVFRRAGGMASYEKKLMKIAKKLKILSNVRFDTEMRPYDQIPIIFNMADVSVMVPNKDQGPLSMYESMICGAVVVASDIQGNRESIHDNMNGFLVNPHNEKELTDKILAALENGIKERFYEYNKVWIHENANWQKNAKKMEDIYHDAIRITKQESM
jgi:glycosyltransferase involved in cell wall biosynthesis